ncbi:restriction endonuclease subunit S [Flavobacterium sp. PL002]|uniref:restriction endonuclease subunit S n=1 Tax=Flavobacterium sp. PL002 TaxID=1897058 RepID=UPI001787E397|nr:restriction endonuclease subunit S [Flavobacterium sp. PL002]MBE0391081.1 Type-1 restriction enzyme EcoKI specificity protein [Flavobacterium sp. PL002]
MLESKKLGEVCKFVRGPFGGSLKKNCFVENGNAVYEQQHAIYNQFSEIRYFINDEKFEEMKRFELKSGDLIMSCSGTMGKVAIVPPNIKKGIINQALLKLTPSKNLDIEYLRYWMSSPDFIQRIEENTVGAAIKNVASVKILKEIEVPVPPLQEQQQIVAILDQAFEAIDQAKANIEKNIANAKELFQSKLNAIFSQKGDGWEEKSLNTICEVKDGTHDSPKYIDKELGIPFVTQKNILDDGISFENTKFISLENHNDFYKRSNVAYNDILFSMIGANRGMACVVDDKRVFSIKNVGLIKSNENYRPKFLLYFFKSSIAQKFIAENSSGSAQGFVSLGKLRTFPIPFTHIENQKKIESIVESLNDSVNSTISNYKQKLNNLEDLKKSILQKAFAGELTSPERTK